MTDGASGPTVRAMATEPMSHADAAWLHMDRRTNLMVINALLWLDRPLDRDAFTEVLLERMIPRFPRFSQIAEDGPFGTAPHWRDDPTFDLRNHLHRMALPEPGDRETLEELVSDLVTMPLDRQRPLWSLHEIEGYGSGSALLVRMHHCIADGVALARVMLSLTDEDVEFGSLSHDGGAGSLLRTAADAVAHPRRTAEQAVADARTLAGMLLAPSDPPGLLKGELGIPRRVAWSPPFSLERVREAAVAHEATINDVLVAAVAGGLRRYVAGQGADPRDVHALVPFNLRSLDGPLPPTLGNRFGLVTVTLPVEPDTSRKRLEAVKAEMKRVKASHEAQISYGVLDLVGRAPAALEARTVDFFTSHGSMVLTNVPGPQKQVHLAGAGVKSVLVWAPCSGSLALSASVFSYCGGVSVGFLSDAGVLPDPAALVRAFRSELRALERLRTGAST
jgi:diacylglycerol O-acyltransferase / wax synthase